MSRSEYMLAYMRARRRPDLHRFSRRVWDVGNAIDPGPDDEARRHDAEQGSRLLLERINALLERRNGGITQYPGDNSIAYTPVARA